MSPGQPLPLLVAVILIIVASVPDHSSAQTNQTKSNQQTGIVAEDANSQIIHRLYEDCLNQGHLDLLPALVSKRVVNHFDDNEQAGLAAFEQNLRHVRAMFPSGHFELDDVVSNGNKAAVRWTMTATFSVPIAGVAPTGKQITHDAIAFYHFDHGKIVEAWVQVDQIGALHQIGVQIPGLPSQPTR